MLFKGEIIKTYIKQDIYSTKNIKTTKKRNEAKQDEKTSITKQVVHASRYALAYQNQYKAQKRKTDYSRSNSPFSKVRERVKKEVRKLKE